MQPSSNGLGGGDGRPPRLSPLTTRASAETSLSQSSTPSDSTRHDGSYTESYATTSGTASPWSFSPLSSSRHRRASATHTPPPVAAERPRMIIGCESNPPGCYDVHFVADAAPPANAPVQLREGHPVEVRGGGEHLAARPSKPSQPPSGLSFRSSFFSFTSDAASSSSSARSSATSSASAPPPTQPANSSGVHHAPQSASDEDAADAEASLLSSTPSSLGARRATTTATLATASQSLPSAPPQPVAAAVSSVTTQVLVPPHGYGPPHPRGSRASLPSAASSTPSSPSLLSGSDEEGDPETGLARRAGVSPEEEPVLTLRVEALEEIADAPRSTPSSPPPHAPLTAGSPLSALAASLETTYGCPALSRLATTLLRVDRAAGPTSFHEAHGSVGLSAAPLTWAAPPLPPTRAATQQQQPRCTTSQRVAVSMPPSSPPVPEAVPAFGEDGEAPALPSASSRRRRGQRTKRPAVVMPAAAALAVGDRTADLAQATAVYAHPPPARIASPPPTDGADDVPLATWMEKGLAATAQGAAPLPDDIPFSALFSTESGLSESACASAVSGATAVLPRHPPLHDGRADGQRGARRRRRASGTASAVASAAASPARALTGTDSAAAPEAAEPQPPGVQPARVARRTRPAAKAGAVDAAAPVAAAAAAAAVHDVKTDGAGAAAPPRARRRAGTSAKNPTQPEAPALRSWWRSMRACAAAAAAAPFAGRPCLWVELAPGYQEAHGALLRQVLVCWGRCTQRCDDGEGAATAPPSAEPAHPGSKKGARARKRQRSPALAAANGLVAQPEANGGAPPPNRAHEEGLVVLLCPTAVPVQEALRWWTTRAYVEHGYVPPLLAVSLASSLPDANPPLLLQAAATHAARLFGANPACSLAVSCTAAGHAALARLLPSAQVFDRLQSCASALGAAVGLPATPPTGLDGDDDSGLAAVLAATAWEAATAPLPLQARRFASMCRWNGLAAALQRRPRRPQLLLQHTTLDATTLQELLKGHASSRAPPALQPAWVTVGLVCPATRNEDTFSCSAQREARVLAARPPPVALSPTHALALCEFGRAFFGLQTYATAVNVLASQARLSSRGLADYLSGYSCVTTGPLCYTVSATLRRYLHVRMAVTLAPLLSCVQSAAADRMLKSAARLSALDTVAAAAAHDGEAPPLAAQLARLARVQWRTVLPELSCTCTPRLYEQVPHTEDGAKVCRHLAQLYHHFTTQQFRVVGSAKEAGVDRKTLLRPFPAQAPPSAPTPPPSKQAGAVTQRPPTPKPPPPEEGAADSDLLVNTVPLALLYSHPSDLNENGGGGGGGGGDASGAAVATAATAERRAADTAGATAVAATRAAVPASRKRRRPASPQAAAAPQLASSVPSAGVSARGTPRAGGGGGAADFHNEAVQYALRLLTQRLQESRSGGGAQNGSGGGGGGGGGAPLSVPAAGSREEGANGVRRRRVRRSGAGETEEQARALQLVEQLLRAQLSPQ